VSESPSRALPYGPSSGEILGQHFSIPLATSKGIGKLKPVKDQDR